METYPILSEAEIDAKPIFYSLQEALEDPENAYSLELMGEEFFADELGEVLLQLPRLQVLVIQGNRDLDALPPEIEALKNLQYLEIRECPLAALPATLGACTELRALVLADLRNLTDFPEGLESLSQLNYVEVTATGITKLPEAIGQWKAVTELNVSNNNLREMPEALGSMESLQKLRSYGNYAMLLPESMTNLSKLEAFDHGDMQFQGISGEEMKARLPQATFRQVTTMDRIWTEGQ